LATLPLSDGAFRTILFVLIAVGYLLANITLARRGFR
jgi:hypothetical protein